MESISSGFANWPRDKQVCYLGKFCGLKRGDLTHSEIAVIMGMSRARISQIIKNGWEDDEEA